MIRGRVVWTGKEDLGGNNTFQDPMSPSLPGSWHIRPTEHNHSCNLEGSSEVWGSCAWPLQSSESQKSQLLFFSRKPEVVIFGGWGG